MNSKDNLKNGDKLYDINRNLSLTEYRDGSKSKYRSPFNNLESLGKKKKKI